MKKILIIVGTVAVLILLTWYADKATRLKDNRQQIPLRIRFQRCRKARARLEAQDLDGKDVSSPITRVKSSS